ncbi:MAG: prepilin-type N-terminal cleavage/methylation domain-containing protein [Bacilli bacterium]|nr:prepilin-type N-terminal cleavage/methylation domain-containing protein [Bacilli bacterium]
MKNLRKNKKGFTLVEVIVVLVILAILIAIAVPSVMKYIDDANDAKYLAQGRAALIATQAELTKDYADDKTLNGSIYSDDGTATSEKELLAAVVKATDLAKLTTITTTDVAFGAKANPNTIKEYVFTIDGKTVTVPVNGTATVK